MSLILHAEEAGRIHGLSISRHAPTISHLLFEDDSLIFCRSTHNEIEVINDILNLYEEASRQCISLEKILFFFFNSNTSQLQREVVKVHLGVHSWVFPLLLGGPNIKLLHT